MDDLTGLKLIQAVDPTKIKVTINEKFSKLTLSSSNKKKKKDNNNKPNDDPGNLEKRQSASRNLIGELCEVENENAHLCVNAILRSKSLSSEENDNCDRTETLSQIVDIKEKQENSATDESMEPLQLSEDLTHQSSNNDFDDLTQKISNLSVSQFNKKVLESPIAVIELSSSEEDTDDNEESIISVSDTSVNSIVKDPYNDYNFMAISDVHSDETNDQQLPCTLSNDRADRIEAFLKDVSHEQRIMQATGRLPDDSLLVHLKPSIECDKKPDNAVLESIKAKIMANADTESMTPTETQSDVSIKHTEKTICPPKQRNMALDDTELMSESDQGSLLTEERSISGNQHIEKDTTKNTMANRLANDDTEANTPNNSYIHSDQSSVEVIDDSVVISETSSDEIESSINITKDKQHDLVPSEEALSSSSRPDSEQHTPIELSLGSVNISARINIKLQINTRSISIDESYEESDSSKEINSSDNVNTTDEASKDKREHCTNNLDEDKFDQAEDERDTSVQIVKNRKSHTTEAIVDLVQLPEAGIIDENVEIEGEGEEFMSNAQKLLTTLYGKSWQTPDVIRTLRRTANTNQIRTNLTFNEKSITKKSVQNLDNSCDLITKVEESVLADFSMFRQNIVKTDLDSTRVIIPDPKANKKLLSHNGSTEPKPTLKKVSCRTPQTELKKKTEKKISAKNNRSRKLVYSDSDSEHNITDDVALDETVMSDDGNESDASDSSWQKSAEETSSDDEYCIKNQNTSKGENSTRSKVPINKRNAKSSTKNRLIYMDLSKDEVTILDDIPTESPPANRDESFKNHLSKILSSCRYEDRPKLTATPTSTGKRRLFTVSYGEELEDESITAICRGETPKKSDLIYDEYSENVRFNGVPIPRSFNIFNKPLEALKTGEPVFKITPSRAITPTMPGTPIQRREEGTPFRNRKEIIYQTPTHIDKHKLNEISSTPSFKYSFLKSLDVCVGKSMCHPDALVFRENFRQKKEDLARILYKLYNGKLFDNKLNIPITWNKKLSNTAGRCLNKKKLGQRLSVVELSVKVLTSADRLRCTLIHELCHAATWVFDGKGGHGAKWKEWARKANDVFPDLPKIGVCHQYDIEYKYTYKCTLCAAKSFYHSKCKKVENIRCSYCYGAIEVFLNKKDKEGNIIPTPVKEPTGFAKFVKEKYQQYKRPDLKHADIMKLLSNEFAALKVAGNAK